MEYSFQFFVCFVILFILLLDLFLVYSAQTKVNNKLLEKEMRIVNQKSQENMALDDVF